jgi:hypothetical protein
MTIKKWSGTAWVDQYVTTNVSSIVASGTPSSSNFLRGDGQWIVPTDTNNFVSSATFASNTLTLNRQGLTALTVDLSSLATDANNFLTGVSGSGNGTVTFTRSGLTNLTWNAAHTHNQLVLAQNPTGTTYGNGVSALPTNFISQGAGDNDAWRIYGESVLTNNVRMVLQLEDDIEVTNAGWIFRNKRTYTPFNATEPFVITGTGDISFTGTVNAGTVPWARLSNIPSTFTPSAHTHVKADITDFAHTHGNITNAGAIGTTADLVAVTTTSGVLTTASRSGIDSRTSFPPSAHNHNRIITQDIRDTTNTPNTIQSFSVQSFFNNQTIPTGLTSWYSTLSVKGWDGVYAAWELAGNATSFAQDGLFFRYGSGTTWQGWQRVFTDTYHPNADKLTTARNIALTGAVTGNANFDGSGNISITTTATSDPVLTLAGDATGSATFTNLGNATLTVAIVDDSHNHIISNVDGLQTALNLKLNTSLKGANSGLAELDSSGKVPAAQLPSYVDDVVMFDPLHNTLRFASTNPTGTTAGSLNEILYSFQSNLYYCCSVVSPPSGYVWTSFGGGGTIPTDGFETGKIYVTTTSNKTYRWSAAQPKDGSIVEISASLALGSTSATAHRGDHGATAYTHSQVTNGTNPHGTTFANIASKPTTLSGFGITDAEPAFTKNTGFNKNFGTTSGTVAQGNDARFTDARTPTAHTHGNITNAGAIGSTTNLVVVTGTSGVLTTSSRSGIDSRASFPPSTHTHDDRYYTESESDSRFINTAGDTMTGLLISRSTTGAMAVNTQGVPGFEVITSGANAAYMTFHRAGNHAVRFGLDTDNQLKVGGWSLGNVAYTLYHTGNLNPITTSNIGSQSVSYATTAGNATTATTLQTARTIALAGDVTGSASFNGSSNISITATVADDSHNHVISNVDGLQDALNLKANLASPALTGIPTAPTASFATNTTQLATTAFVQTALSGLVASAPTTLDTLNELAAALGDDPNFATTVSNSIGTKVTANTAITAGTATKITFDTKGLVTGGTTLAAGDLPTHTHSIANVTGLQTALDGKAASSHTHGNITNAGAIGSTSNLVVVTGASGVLTTSSRSGIDSRSSFPPAGHAISTHSDVSISSPTSGQVLKWNGLAWTNQADNNTTYTLGSFGVTSTAAELNILDGVTATTAELNVLDGITATTTELNYTDGVTSNIQTQLNSRLPIPGSPYYSPTTNSILKFNTTFGWITTAKQYDWHLIRNHTSTFVLDNTGAVGLTGGTASVTVSLAAGDVLMMELSPYNSVIAGYTVPIVIVRLGGTDTTPTSLQQGTLIKDERFSSTTRYQFTTKVSGSGSTIYFDDTFRMQFLDTSSALSIMTEASSNLYIGKVWRLTI